MKKFACILVLCLTMSTMSWATELKSIIAAAQKGDVEAQTELGYMYYHGDGVARDYNKAIEWYEKGKRQTRHDLA